MTQLKQQAENYRVTKMEEQQKHGEFGKDVLDDKMTSVYNNKCSYSNFVGLSPPTSRFDPSTGELKGGGGGLPSCSSPKSKFKKNIFCRHGDVERFT
jgi:hypothetical protein